MEKIKEFFKTRYASLKFRDGGFKKLLLGFIIVNSLFIINLFLTLFLDYQTEHENIYPSTTYVIFLIIFEVYYLILFVIRKKKSVSDVFTVLFGFLLLWELGYKLGWTNNDLLIPSPEGLFNIYQEKSGEVTDGIFAVGEYDVIAGTSI